MVVFSNVVTIFSKKISAWSISNSYTQLKEEKMLCYEFCERYKIYLGSYDPKSKRVLPRNVKQRDI